MTIDTAALRAVADDRGSVGANVPVSFATVRALCDGYDEAQRLRDEAAAIELDADAYRAERDAARQALADLVADLRALCDEVQSTESMVRRTSWSTAREVRAVIDRHAPEGDA